MGMRKKNFFRMFLFTIMGIALCGSGTKSANGLDNSSVIQNEPRGVLKSNVFSSEETDYTGELLEGLNFTLYSISETETSASVSLSFDMIQGYQGSFYLGYGDNADNYVPATLVYEVSVNGKVETRQSPINRSNQNAFYDAIGAPDQDGASLGSRSVSNYVDIPLVPGEELLTENFHVNNIANAVKNANGRFEPEKDSSGNIVFNYCNMNENSVKNVYTFSKLATLDYLGYSNFYNYTDFTFNSSGFGSDVYDTLGASYRRQYQNNLGDIEDGLSWIRTRLNFSNQTVFRFEMKDGSLIEKNATSQQIDITNGNAEVGVLYSGVDGSQVENIKIYGLMITIDIYSSMTGKAVPSSAFSTRFSIYDCHLQPINDVNGSVSIEAVENPYAIDSTLIIVLSTVIFAVVYLLVSGGLYFYLKEKNKNDEFKRMRTKQYWETNLMGLVCLESLILAIESITLRATLLLTSFKVYNEIDIYIVVSCVMSIIFGGYFIKYFIGIAKNNIEKRRVEKLKLNKDSFDDGTLIMPSSNK